MDAPKIKGVIGIEKEAEIRVNFSNFADAMHTMTNSSLMAYTPYCIQVWKNTNSQPHGMVHMVAARDFDMAVGGVGTMRTNPPVRVTARLSITITII